MAGETTPDTGAVEHAGGGAGGEQADESASAPTVSSRSSAADESREAGHSTEQADKTHARLTALEKQVRQMRRLFANHSHAAEEERQEETQQAPEVVQSSPEGQAVPPKIAEKPPVETASHLQEKQEARKGYFHRAHRLKARSRAGT